MNVSFGALLVYVNLLNMLNETKSGEMENRVIEKKEYVLKTEN